MSDTWARRRANTAAYETCVPCGKQLHRTRKSALDAAAHNRAEFGKEYTPYRCRVGPGFHLTTVREDAR